MIEIRPCTTHEEYASVAQLEMTIWDVSPADTITTHMIHVIDHIGGNILGAFDGDTMVGMSVATPMKMRGGLWSHMAGVLPTYQSQGIGYQIKQVQRDWALENSYTEIRWSFDPAMRRNAQFNFHKLGVTIHLYHESFYGEMSDGINAGVPSDRFEAIWRLDQSREKPVLPDNMSYILRQSGEQFLAQSSLTDNFYTIDCPYDFPAIKRDNLALAIEWRHAMRKAFTDAFSAGYQVIDFVTDYDAQSCHYVVAKMDSD